MFLDVLQMIYSGVSSVVDTIDYPLFNLGGVSISLWEIILGLFLLGIIFGFFLAPRPGSGLSSIGNVFNSVKRR